MELSGLEPAFGAVPFRLGSDQWKTCANSEAPRSFGTMRSANRRSAVLPNPTLWAVSFLSLAETVRQGCPGGYMRGGRSDSDRCAGNDAKKWMRGLCQEIESRLVPGTCHKVACETGSLSKRQRFNHQQDLTIGQQPGASHWQNPCHGLARKQALGGMQTPSLLIKALIEAFQGSIAFYQLTYAIPLNTLASDSRTCLHLSFPHQTNKPV